MQSYSNISVQSRRQNTSRLLKNTDSQNEPPIHTSICVSVVGPGTPSLGWWSQAGSNRRPPACKAGALPAELWPRSVPPRRPAAGTATNLLRPERMVGLGRFELPTSPLSGVRSNQLSYRPGIRPGPANEQQRDTRASASETGNLLWVLTNESIVRLFGSLVKGGDPAARSRTATLLRLHPSH